MAKKDNGNTEKVVESTKALEGQDAVDYIQTQSSDLDVAGMMNSAEMLKVLDEALKAPAEKFKTQESDFWKPAKDGEELRGVYLGSKPNGRYLVHAIGTRGQDGKPLAKRVNGSTILTKEIQRGAIGQPVRIVYKGEGKTDGGNRLQKFEVSWL